MTRTQILASTAALAASLGLSGCLGIHHGHPDSRGPRNVKSSERRDLAVPSRWQQIYLGSPPKPLHVGYLKTDIEAGPNRGGHWVFDADFKLFGRITPQGQTFRIKRDGSETSLGGFALNHAILRLHDQTKETEVSLIPMPEPRG